jgi:hypothetical protein
LAETQRSSCALAGGMAEQSTRWVEGFGLLRRLLGGGRGGGLVRDAVRRGGDVRRAEEGDNHAGDDDRGDEFEGVVVFHGRCVDTHAKTTERPLRVARMRAIKWSKVFGRL